ncbi:MAG: glycosyltransferase, partial [Paracoccaceae bacterium]|nr:glycosyltransferase [Paracoccaceae bacterium]
PAPPANDNQRCRIGQEVPDIQQQGMVLARLDGAYNDKIRCSQVQPRRIEAAEAAGRGVIAISDLADGAVAALLNGAEALLFPSLAEGYGLPLVEAAALGVPVVCSDLPVFREILDSYPVYLDPADNNSWMETIAKLTLAARQRGGDKAKTGQRRASPDWADHFNAVLSLV